MALPLKSKSSQRIQATMSALLLTRQMWKPMFSRWSFQTAIIGQYTFTLLEALDHADASLANTLDFDIPVIAVDADNTDSASSSLNVTITDDLQQTQNQTLSIVEPVTTSGAGGPPSTGIVDVMPTDSADGATVTQFMYGTDGPFVLDQTNFTEQEFAVADGKLFVKLDGSVRFEPDRNLDHSGGDIVRTITVTTSDFDKDVETATVTLTITDGVDPVINIVPDVYLSEVNLTDGSMPSSGPVSSTHTITYTEGSDNFSHFRIDTNEFNFGGLLKSNGSSCGTEGGSCRFRKLHRLSLADGSKQ